MSRDDFRLDRAVQNDVETLQSVGTGSNGLTIAAVLEGVCWSIVVLFAILMLAAMPFVGVDKLIPGQVWLGYSIAGILIFGIFGYLVRIARQHGEEVDRQVSRKFHSGR